MSNSHLRRSLRLTEFSTPGETEGGSVMGERRNKKLSEITNVLPPKGIERFAHFINALV